MRNLEELLFAHKSIYGNGEAWGDFYTWPPRLRKLHLSGRILENHPLFNDRFPSKLVQLSIAHCPGLSSDTVYLWLYINSASLDSLQVTEWSSKDQHDNLNHISAFLPRLRYLQIVGRCVNDHFFNYFRVTSVGTDGLSKPHSCHPLEKLVLRRHGSWAHRVHDQPNFSPLMVLYVVVVHLHHLCELIVDDAFGWWTMDSKRKSLSAIYCVMRYRAQLRGDKGRVSVTGTSQGSRVVIQ